MLRPEVAIYFSDETNYKQLWAKIQDYSYIQLVDVKINR